MKVITQEIKNFPSTSAFREWLASHHGQTGGIWLRFLKKTSGEKSLTYPEARDEALCYGWIDGQAKAYDERSWLQRFTPRRSASPWSKINTQHAERLIKAGRMTPAGLKQVEEAKADGRWSAAYDSPGNAAPPEDFLTELDKNKKAKAIFTTLNKANIYAILSPADRKKAGDSAETSENDPGNVITRRKIPPLKGVSEAWSITYLKILLEFRL
jgi:uncharacterized protein YdeI (YjbR/CyaY-like superfamily)